MNPGNITEHEFAQFQRFIYDAAGITLSSAKKALVTGRLAKRLQSRGLATYTEYFRLLTSGTAPAEVQTAVDLLTTNETYFFREPKHFELLRDVAKALEAKFGEPRKAALVWKPQNTVPVNDEQGEKLLKLIETLNEHDDVQNVYANFEVSDALMQKLSA